MDFDLTVIPAGRIEQAILQIRGLRVMVDADLAMLYGVTTKVLNQAVKRTDLGKISEDNKVIFDHVAARIRFHMDIFWSKADIGKEALRLWLETYQITKDFKRRGIVEVKLL